MGKLLSRFSRSTILFRLLRRMLLVVLLALLTGSLTALFLCLLDKATLLRWQQPVLIALLPPVGGGIAWLYRRYGKDAVRGNNLIIDEIHRPGGGVPAHMGPLILFTTLLTHLAGGSAGREGTAVQLSGSLAAGLGRRWKLAPASLRTLLTAGIAAGFGAVFGTPVAGTIFELEVTAIRRTRYEAILPCFAAAVLADAVTTAWGIRHTHYQIAFQVSRMLHGIAIPTAALLLKSLMAGIIFGMAARLFSVSHRAVHREAARLEKYHFALAPFASGIIILLLALVPGMHDYLGLGVTSAQPGGVSIVNAFSDHGTPAHAWLLKLLLTVLTLGAGFKGGEVTPLFFIGATLGNTVAQFTGAPTDLMAGLGFIAVFAGAANTPLACTILGVELFGGGHLLYYATACFSAYYCSGPTGIYNAQQADRKTHA